MTTSDWGRVAEDGTVYVRTPEGERPVGQYPEGSPEEALAFFTKRYDELAGSVHLLEQRVMAGVVAPDEAAEAVRALRTQVAEANAVGDLTSLVGRLDALGPVISQQRMARKAERAERAAAGQGRQGEAGRRGREARREQRLAQRRQPAPRPPRPLEGAPPARQGHRRLAVAAVLDGSHDVHPAAQGALRRAGREARGGPPGQAAAGEGGRGPGPLA